MGSGLKGRLVCAEVVYQKPNLIKRRILLIGPLIWWSLGRRFSGPFQNWHDPGKMTALSASFERDNGFYRVKINH
jgi:hypothetical protein